MQKQLNNNIISYTLHSTKNRLLLITLVINQFIVYGQSEFIELLDKGDAIENLIPDKWSIIATTEGDLNNDGESDVAFIIENTDPKNIQQNESNIGRATINLNPRILAIYFKSREGEFFKKLQSDSFILLQDSPTMDEPFDGMKISQDGTFKIDFKFWYSAGSWSMSNHSYTFKFKKHQFQLIEYESSERHRGTGDTNDCTIDFLKGKMSIFESTTDENNVDKTTENIKDFELKSLKTLESLGKPFQWKFNGFQI